MSKRIVLQYSSHDVTILARTIDGEAEGESLEAKIAVGWAIRNRAEIDLWGDNRPDWWGEGIAGVCLKSGQFDCWSDANRVRLLAATPDKPGYRDCLVAAALVLGEDTPDPTFGSTHYYNPSIVPEPKWARGKTAVVKKDQQLFFNDIEPGA